MSGSNGRSLEGEALVRAQMKAGPGVGGNVQGDLTTFQKLNKWHIVFR